MKKYLIIFVISFLIGFLFYVLYFDENRMQNAEDDVNLTTQDGVNLNGAYYPKDSETAVILVHMLNSNKESYNGFASLLNKDYAVLSFDSRGHGKSDLYWNNFSEEDFNEMVLDVKSAKKFLVGKSYKNIYLIGASIGANTVLNYASSDDKIKKIVLLSPGLNYQGVSTEESARDYTGDVLILVSEGDQYSFNFSEKLLSEFSGDKKIMKLDGNLHGTNMLREDNLMEKIIDWLKK